MQFSPLSYTIPTYFESMLSEVNYNLEQMHFLDTATDKHNLQKVFSVMAYIICMYCMYLEKEKNIGILSINSALTVQADGVLCVECPKY